MLMPPKEYIEILLDQALPHVPEKLQAKIEWQLYPPCPPRNFPGTKLVYWEKDVCIYHMPTQAGKSQKFHLADENREYILWHADIVVRCVKDILVELSSVEIVSLSEGDRLYFIFGSTRLEEHNLKIRNAWGTPKWLTLTDHIRVMKDRYKDWMAINRPEDHVETT